MATRNGAEDSKNINPAFSKSSVQRNFGMGGKPKPNPSPTWSRQQLDNWIGDTVGEGDFSSTQARWDAISAVAKKALSTNVVSNKSAAIRTAKHLLRNELRKK